MAEELAHQRRGPVGGPKTGISGQHESTTEIDPIDCEYEKTPGFPRV